MGDQLQNKVAFVTGAASGLGAAIATRFAEEGAKVVIADLNEQSGNALAKKIGATASFQKLDVANEQNWMEAVDASATRLGRFDVLVNCAGISGGEVDIEQMTLAKWNQVMGINLTGSMLGCQNAIRAMKKFGNGGSIINISSTVGIKAWASRISYGTSKAGVAHMTKAIALHCGKSGYNIRVNCVHPGTFDTPILDDALPHFGNDRAAMLKTLGQFQVLGRVGEPRELANAVLFLASDESSFVTAESLVCDGGFTVL